MMTPATPWGEGPPWLNVAWRSVAWRSVDDDDDVDDEDLHTFLTINKQLFASVVLCQRLAALLWLRGWGAC